MFQRVANHKGAQDWRDAGPAAPINGRYVSSERHTRSQPLEDESLYGWSVYGLSAHHNIVGIEITERKS